MMKRALIVLALLALGATVRGQSPAPPRPASTDDVVAEIRALRADIQQMADTSIRAQLLVARLQVQEQRISSLVRQLADTEEKMRGLEAARNPFLTEMLKNMDEDQSDPEAAKLFAGMKTQMEKIENGDPVLNERQASLTRLIAEEQARWAAFNKQLEQLESRLPAPKR
jgi:UDP-glucose 6-dehydrogenase